VDESPIKKVVCLGAARLLAVEDRLDAFEEGHSNERLMNGGEGLSCLAEAYHSGVEGIAKHGDEAGQAERLSLLIAVTLRSELFEEAKETCLA
jgi:hypothetical protein